ncbi:hypothetical protein RB595_008282 [Gaeumannomyces hyphopodioides]
MSGIFNTPPSKDSSKESDSNGVAGVAKAGTSTLGNTVSGLTNTVGGVVGGAGRGLGETVSGITGGAGKPLGDGIGNAATAVEGGGQGVAKSSRDAGEWKTN